MSFNLLLFSARRHSLFSHVSSRAKLKWALTIICNNRFRDQIDGWTISYETRNIAGRLVMNIQSFYPIPSQRNNSPDWPSSMYNVMCCHYTGGQAATKNSWPAVLQEPRDGRLHTTKRYYSCEYCLTEYMMCVGSRKWLEGIDPPQIAKIVRTEHFVVLSTWVDFGEMRGDTDLFEWNCLTQGDSLHGYE